MYDSTSHKETRSLTPRLRKRAIYGWKPAESTFAYTPANPLIQVLNMKQTENGKKGQDKRSEPRKILDQYFSIEFSISKMLPVHQFKIRDLSPSGIGILVNESSAVLDHLEAGSVLEMKYNPKDLSDLPEYLKTEICHITKVEEGKYKGHYLVGMLILERGES